MSIPKVSVIVPIFNSEMYLPSLLASLLSQSESCIEILAINDGSTDGSLEILQSAAENDKRIVILNQNNEGLSSARNHGLRHARGKWIAFVDSDDWVDQKLLQTWCEYAETMKLDVVIGNAFCFSKQLPHHIDNPPPMLKHQPWNDVINGEEWIIRSIAANEWRHYVWLQLTRRDLIVQTSAQFIEGMVHEDIIWTLHLAINAKRIGFLQIPLYGYRINNSESITSNPSQKAVEARAYSYLAIIKNLIITANSNHNPVLRKSLLRHANREAGHFLGLIRKKIHNPITKRILATKFIQWHLRSSLFLGATNLSELWQAIRCCFILQKCIWASRKPSI
jgi:glycosyltransferase involved in cell wall biosynthesis